MGIGMFSTEFGNSNRKHRCHSLHLPRYFSSASTGGPQDANPAIGFHRVLTALGTSAPFRGMSHVESASI